jgi:hypothetical protein
MGNEENLLVGWVAKALDLLTEVDEYQQSAEWRRDVDALKVRFHNRVHADY